MVASVDASHDAFVRARWAVIGFAVAAIVLALVLGFAISWSLVGAVSTMDAGLAKIASGDFSLPPPELLLVDPMTALDLAVLLRAARLDVAMPDPEGLHGQRKSKGELMPVVPAESW
jgi:methyl-accepting chemotaxis protein